MIKNWILPLWIGRRLRHANSSGRSFSGPVIAVVTAAISVSSVVMIIAIVTGTGLQHEIKNKIYSFRGHVQIKKYVDDDDLLESESILLTNDLLSAIKAHPSVRHVQSSAYRTAILKSTNYFEGCVLKGIDEHFDASRLASYIKEGTFFQKLKGTESDSIVLSAYHARVLDVKAGDRLAVYFIREAPKTPLLRYLIVSGIYESGVEDVDKQFAWVDIDLIRSINRWEADEVGALEVFIKEGSKPEEVAAELSAVLPFDLQSVSAKMAFRQLFQWMDLFDINILIIIIVMVVVSAINLSSALMILIVERTRMIGLLKALGAENTLITKIFLYKAFVILTRGLFIGNAIALGYAWMQRTWKIIKLDQTAYFVDSVPVYFDLGWILSVNTGTLVMCLLILLVPSRYISAIPAARVLKFE
ncbi:ABC transporter permease [Thermaurantimonas aggregans]|uniref:ABC transporter permease n=1 Tax=Thermaurantimonas aggregans TaxID=2173829 RepID=UPI0023F1A7C8|nr:FtsX-like permease family protein [Thermaurantimonas aggregans]MCX8147775.1 FtsX-like permease family protein [Thermaurantimonas aggregans]